MTEQPQMTRKELAREMGVCQRTIDRWRLAGKMPFHRSMRNGAVTFDRSVIALLRKKVG